MHKTRSGQLESARCCRLLCYTALMSGSNINTTLMQRMRTPLHLAALQGDAAAVMGLCTYKAKVDLKDEHALTPLHKAAAQGHNEAAEELLAHNANPDATDEVTPVPRAVVQCCVVACVCITCAYLIGQLRGMNSYYICSFR